LPLKLGGQIGELVSTSGDKNELRSRARQLDCEGAPYPARGTGDNAATALKRSLHTTL